MYTATGQYGRLPEIIHSLYHFNSITPATILTRFDLPFPAVSDTHITPAGCEEGDEPPGAREGRGSPKWEGKSIEDREKAIIITGS